MIPTIVVLLIILKTGFEIFLDLINRKEVLKNSGTIPESYASTIDNETYQKTIQYTLAKTNFSLFSHVFETILLLIVLFSGILPWLYDWNIAQFGLSTWTNISFLIGISLLLSLPSMPLDIYFQFNLEERFGFNKTNAKTYIGDKIKGLLISLIIGTPILWALFTFVETFSTYWWLIAFVALSVFQIVMMIVFPAFIMPLFNKFEPLEEGDLKTRLMSLIDRSGFKAKRLTVMDGSRRSKHSNAFFTGFGKFRQVVLYDTLVSQLDEIELEGVLAHEIGHYQKGHVIKMMVTTTCFMLIGLYCLSLLLNAPAFGQAFGFEATPVAPGFLLFSLLSGTVTFWITPAMNLFSRKNEYEADAFAVEMLGKGKALVDALRKLAEKNLSNLTPHPIYSFFHYSHPTLLEREKAILNCESSLNKA